MYKCDCETVRLLAVKMNACVCVWDSETGEATLRIVGVSSEDDGVYTCVAANDLGSVTSSASLRVLGETPHKHAHICTNIFPQYCSVIPHSHTSFHTLFPCIWLNSACLCSCVQWWGQGELEGQLWVPLHWGGRAGQVHYTSLLLSLLAVCVCLFTLLYLLSPQRPVLCGQALRTQVDQVHGGGQAG